MLPGNYSFLDIIFNRFGIKMRIKINKAKATFTGCSPDTPNHHSWAPRRHQTKTGSGHKGGERRGTCNV
jgi:hypothetical protein